MTANENGHAEVVRYISGVVWRFVVESPALKMESKHVSCTEFGDTVLTSCNVNLKLPWPLSPPNFNQIRSEQIPPLCQVNPWQDLGNY